LRPEFSRNLEIGTNVAIHQNKLSSNISLRGFRHRVDDWIIWIPGGREEGANGEVISFWYPDNIREVLAYGFQYRISTDWQLPVKNLSSTLTLDGTYNKSLNKKSISSLDRSVNKQLPYTPVDVVNVNWYWRYNTWHAGVTGLYRSKRFVETNNELPPLEAYTLWNVAVGKRFSAGSLIWQLGFQVNNITAARYETFENRAMPGRNYRINLSFNFNKNNEQNAP
jgi:iron complex outermembrane receptor protein